MEALPIAIFWALAVWGGCGKPQVLLYLFFGSMSFGAFAVIPPELTGGLTLTPTPMIALLIILRSLLERGGPHFFVSQALNPRGLLLLFLFWLVATITTVLMPRVFAGEVMVIPVRLTAFTIGEPLWPSTQNFSQFCYLTISVATVFAFAWQLRSEGMRQHALRAVFFGGAIVIATGFLDWLSLYLPMDVLLEPFRTATYALLTEVEMFGGKRVVGLMPEASAFGGVSVSFLAAVYFFRPAMLPGGMQERIAPLLMAGLLLFVWLSTSSAAYVSLAVFFALAALQWGIRQFRAPTTRASKAGFWLVWGGLVAACLVLLFVPRLLDPLLDQFDTMVLQKKNTDSYEERSMWTEVSWQALWDSYGMGVGLGSTRASNFLAVLFASTGMLGALLYCGFVLRSFFRRTAEGISHNRAVLLKALPLAFAPGFASALLVGSTPDFGLFNACLFALSFAVANVSGVCMQRVSSLFVARGVPT
ncbi:hypothetical protein GCM10027046_16780 [Uliginosibacterium flavum]